MSRMAEWACAAEHKLLSAATLDALVEYDAARAVEALNEIGLTSILGQTFRRVTAQFKDYPRGVSDGLLALAVAREAQEAGLAFAAPQLRDFVESHKWNFLLIDSDLVHNKISIVFSVDQYIARATILRQALSEPIRDIDWVLNAGDIGTSDFKTKSWSWTRDVPYGATADRSRPSMGKAALVGGLLGGTTGAIIGAAYAHDRMSGAQSTPTPSRTMQFDGTSSALTWKVDNFWDDCWKTSITFDCEANEQINGTADIVELVERAFKRASAARVLRMEQMAWLESHGNLNEYDPLAQGFREGVAEDPDLGHALSDAEDMLATRFEFVDAARKLRASSGTAGKGCLVGCVSGALMGPLLWLAGLVWLPTVTVHAQPPVDSLIILLFATLIALTVSRLWYKVSMRGR